MNLKHSFEIQKISTVTCPECSHVKKETMPENSCLYFYTCPGCGKTLTPLPGDCCIFCSYGDVKCPPIQIELKK